MPSASKPRTGTASSALPSYFLAASAATARSSRPCTAATPAVCWYRTCRTRASAPNRRWAAGSSSTTGATGRRALASRSRSCGASCTGALSPCTRGPTFPTGTPRSLPRACSTQQTTPQLGARGPVKVPGPPTASSHRAPAHGGRPRAAASPSVASSRASRPIYPPASGNGSSRRPGWTCSTCSCGRPDPRDPGLRRPRDRHHRYARPDPRGHPPSASPRRWPPGRAVGTAAVVGSIHPGTAPTGVPPVTPRLELAASEPHDSTHELGT